MQKDSIEAPRPHWRRGSAVIGAASQVGGPVSGLGYVVDDRQFEERSLGRLEQYGAREEFEYLVDTGALRRGDQHHRSVQLLGQFRHVHSTAASLEIVGHV